jgi:uncharacterized protein (TIGR03437 family)
MPHIVSPVVSPLEASPRRRSDRSVSAVQVCTWGFCFLSMVAQPAVCQSLNAFQNAASYGYSGQVAPGEMLVLYGSNMGPSVLAQFQVDSSGYVPTQLAGTRVLFNGFAAPIIYTQANQVSAVVPYEIMPQPGCCIGSSVNIVVEYQSVSSNTLTVPVVASAPGLFTAASNGSGQASATNQDGTINSAANPARLGSVVSLYATGEGQTSPLGVDGKPAAPPLPQPVLSVSVMIGGLPAQVDYAGGAPGEVAGVMQVNVLIPPNVQPGNVPVIVRVGSAPSQAAVTIAVIP